MRTLIVGALMAVLVPVAAGAQQGATAEALQGRWVVTGGEHGGNPMDSLKGGVMTVSGNGFEIRTASGNMLKGTLRLDPSATPSRMDIVHADGVVWEAIYEVSGEAFRLNYVEQGGPDPRPSAFTTSPDTEASIVTLRREPPGR